MSRSTDRHVVILGAGASGLSLAWRLASHGVRVDVLEASAIVGGLAGTVREDGYSMDFGPHSFFSEDDRIQAAVLDLFGGRLEPQPRRVKFYYRGKYLDYPLTAASVLFQMGPWAGLRAAMSFLKSKVTPRKVTSGHEETVEDWAVSSFGHYLYQSFFKPYTEQFWKVPCDQLSSRSIPSHTRTSFLKTLQLLVRERISKHDASLIEREKLPTYYPESGFGEITEKIADAVTAAGGRIHFSSRAQSVQEYAGGSIRVTFKKNDQLEQIGATHLVSTIPLHLFVKMLEPAPAKDVIESTDHLDYRALVVLGLVTDKQDLLGCGYIYQLDRPYNRISEMNKFSPGTSPADKNILCLEVTCLRGSDGWKASKEELFDICAPSLASDRIIAPGDVKKLLLVKAPYAYPIYRKDYAVHLNRLLDEVERRKNMSTLGRSGQFMYMDSDKCMRRAFDFGDQMLREMGVHPGPQPGESPAHEPNS